MNAASRLLSFPLAEATRELKDLRLKLFNLRLQQQRGEVKNNRVFAQTRKDIARLQHRLTQLEGEVMTQQSATSTPSTAPTKSRRQQKVGRVVSNKMDKTIVVVVESLKKHRIYKRTYKQTKRFHAHDEENVCQIGDIGPHRGKSPVEQAETLAFDRDREAWQWHQCRLKKWWPRSIPTCHLQVPLSPAKRKNKEQLG